MSIQASWLDKKWTIDATALNGIGGLSGRKELDAKEQETKDGKPPTNTKGYKPQDFTIAHTVSPFVGTDPVQEYESWKSRLGKRAPFYVGGKRFGPAVAVLDKVEFSTNAISDRGIFLSAEISLTFSEDTNAAPAPTAAVELYVGDASPDAPGYNPNGTAAVKSAYNVRPSASAIASKST